MSEEVSNMSKEDFPRVISLREKIAYGVGDLGNNFLFDMGQLYLLKYFTDSVGISPAVAGGVFLVAKIWDAFADIGVGTWIDHRKFGKKGKFRPLILYAALPLAILSIANFSIPGSISITAKEVWAYVMYMLFGTMYSVSNIAYGSMQPSMTRNGVERSELATFRMVGSNLGALVSQFAFMPVVLMLPTKELGYFVAIVIFSVLGVLFQLWTYKGVKERYVEKYDEKQKKEKFSDILTSYKAVFKNWPLLCICLANLFSFSAFNVVQSVQYYFAQYNLHNIEIVSYMSFLTVGFAILGTIIVPWLSKKVGKRISYLIGCFFWVIAYGLGFFFTKNGLTFAIFTAFAYFGNGIIQALNWSLISDVVEFGEWKTGVRSEGIVYSSYTFFRKLSQALAGLIPGIVLTAIGYVPNHAQTVGALLGIRSLLFLYPVAMGILTAIMFAMYPISEEKYEKIMLDLEQRRAAKSLK